MMKHVIRKHWLPIMLGILKNPITYCKNWHNRVTPKRNIS